MGALEKKNVLATNLMKISAASCVCDTRINSWLAAGKCKNLLKCLHIFHSIICSFVGLDAVRIWEDIEIDIQFARVRDINP